MPWSRSSSNDGFVAWPDRQLWAHSCHRAVNPANAPRPHCLHSNRLTPKPYPTVHLHKRRAAPWGTVVQNAGRSHRGGMHPVQTPRQCPPRCGPWQAGYRARLETSALTPCVAPGPGLWRAARSQIKAPAVFAAVPASDTRQPPRPGCAGSRAGPRGWRGPSRRRGACGKAFAVQDFLQRLQLCA